ncbi:MAG: transglycosylase SLT domain-containing protein [Candidatus Riflebacteria bacterium]|nr:transglycosylase SLT domain-containing protein [Candidatus Riflebacteria bacterium]
MRTTSCILMLALALSSLPVDAAIYSYRDDRGRLFLTDNPPNKKYKIVVTSRKDRAAPDLPTTSATTVQVVSEMSPQKVLLPNDETYCDIINEAAKYYGLDPYLIKAVIKVESDFDPTTVSSKGARGLMQLIPGTAKLVGCSNAFDPRDNILGGAKYLRSMLERFQGNLDHALAGYNAGPGRVEQYGGVPPIRETRNYVTKVNHYYSQYRSGAGITEPAMRITKVTRSMSVVPSALSQKLHAAYAVFLENDVEGAIRAYQDILTMYPRNTQSLYNLACLMDMERRYDEAIETYKSALRQDPFLDKAIYNLAIIYERMGRHKDAIASWKKYTLATKEEEKIAMAERYINELEEYAAVNP